MTAVTLMLLVMSICGACSSLAAPCDAPDARRFVPAAIVWEGHDPNAIECVVQPFRVAASEPAEYLTVAYAGGAIGAFSVIKGAGENAAVVFSLASPGMPERTPKIETEDVDGDGVPEIFVSWASPKDLRHTWAFQYHAGAFRSITPPDPVDDESSALTVPSLIDFDGDGRKDAVDLETVGMIPPASEDEVPLPIYEPRLYRYTDGGFAASPQHLTFFASYGRVVGKPRPIEERFTFSGTNRSRTLRIVNDAGVGAEVTSATVLLNGVPVVGPANFKSHTARFDVPVRLLEGENIIAVEIEGNPKSGLALFID